VNVVPEIGIISAPTNISSKGTFIVVEVTEVFRCVDVWLRLL
jgi:hypothetical protein